jgi:nicotinate phosphoribosyltransferase
VTNPGIKKIIRIYDKVSGKMKADILALAHENFHVEEDLVLTHPKARWKKMTLKGGTYETKELLVPVFRKGEKVYESPSVMEIRAYRQQQMDTLWEEYKRLVNPAILPVDPSDELYALKEGMLSEYKKEGGDGK